MNTKTIRNIVLIGGVALLVAACGGIKKSPSLLKAEESHARAKNNPQVLKYASSELDRAEQALSRAATAENEAEMNTLAYVGGTRTKTAIAVAERKAAMARLDELSKLKDQEQLSAREMEIERERRLREQQAQLQKQALSAKEMELRQREEALAKAEAEREALKQELAALEAKKTERGMVMTLGDVLFETGKAALLPGAMNTIDRLAQFLKEYPDKTVLVEGHTDDVGSAEFNQRLSEQRAASVRWALLDRGIASNRVDTVGMGESTPVADNTTEAGRLKNRRVEIVIRD
jgi:outer membrane protein OmpA-like peptidoglycan-associated protein